MSQNVAWNVFFELLTSHLGAERRAQTIFCEQTKYSLSNLQHWRKRNEVPSYVVQDIKAIKVEDCDFTNFRGFHKKQFTDRLIELSAGTKSLRDISLLLSDEFNRKVTENAVKGARYRHREKIASYRPRVKDSI